MSDNQNNNSAPPEHVITAPKVVRQMLSSGVGKEEILGHLVAMGEKMAGPGSTCSILRLDENGLLRNGSSPKLPSDYLQAIDFLKPDPNLGTCASAAATGKVVVTMDFYADEKWAELRHLPLGLGYLSAWSMPIMGPSSTVLGTFGTYYRVKRAPTPEEQAGMRILVQAAAEVFTK